MALAATTFPYIRFVPFSISDLEPCSCHPWIMIHSAPTLIHHLTIMAARTVRLASQGRWCSDITAGSCDRQLDYVLLLSLTVSGRGRCGRCGDEVVDVKEDDEAQADGRCPQPARADA